MGVSGLTTFIEQNRSDNILKDYILQKTNLIIDGNSVMCFLYRQWHDSSMEEASHFECFGGNYDVFGKIICDFFELLAQCNIIPYVVFDGGYEHKKLEKIVSKRKVQETYASTLNPVSEKKEKTTFLFGLFMFQVFNDIITEKGIKSETCFFEGDIRIANIAKEKNCPILSYDSDYYIYANLYIPFKSIHIKFKNLSSRLDFGLQTCISCKCYKQEYFLEQFHGLQVKSLPILAVLAGNDFINHYEVKCFCQENFKFNPKNKIESIINWLKSKNSKDALREIFYYFSGNEEICNKIEAVIKIYNLPDSKNLNDSQPLSNTGASTSAINIITEELENNINFDSNNIHPEFLQKLKRGQYPRSFMNIIVHNKYFHLVQVENYYGEHSHKISFSILSAIHKLLTNRETPMTYIGPIDENVPLCNITLPIYEEINALDKSTKQKYILNILAIDNIFFDCLIRFSETWHVFLLTVKYYLKKKSNNWPLIYSLIMCKLVLSYVDKKVGFFRSKSLFEQFKFISDEQETEFSKSNKIQSALQNITKNDSFQCLKSLIVYFEVDEKTKTNPAAFNRDVAHSISEFQSCLLHICDLNTLFDFTFCKLNVRECLNCTFIYNLTTNYKDLSSYVKLLENSPIILHCFNLIVDTLKNSTVGTVQEITSRKRGREKNEEKLEIKRVKISN
ncbi:unnamed protein product [Psylliodes chrysocephalus]|uniref:XPG N-terminal domain-containing protein n=1 Tax=Psylliodes chrysocephalus TaxID=3402493 RepID=A0A9P0CUN0_9CUCU|nr:unnamed protein product [Psylliodes chrysocephala]